MPEEPENEYAGLAVPEEEREPGIEGRFYTLNELILRTHLISLPI